MIFFIIGGVIGGFVGAILALLWVGSKIVGGIEDIARHR
jgi:hypothetical protein